MNNNITVLALTLIMVLGNSSIDSSIFCPPSFQSLAMEALLDYSAVFHDLCYVNQSQGADRHGIKAARDVVCQQVPEKKTSSPF